MGGQVAGMEGKMSVYRVFDKKPEIKEHQENLDVEGRIIA
jgi:hypothetical protein